jgi:2-dehydro-3-deoxyglucarate aldolase
VLFRSVEEEARRYLAMGMTYVAVGSDVGLLRNASQALCDRFRASAPSG